jgi:hypothetical protein
MLLSTRRLCTNTATGSVNRRAALSTTCRRLTRSTSAFQVAAGTRDCPHADNLILTTPDTSGPVKKNEETHYF